jgi:ferric-dicitrate binding protein FerR (iron transport regulator)
MPRHDHDASQEEMRVRFELLSAYIDGEVTPSERLQVQHWLDTEPEFKQLYTRLRCLPMDLQQIPIPSQNVDLLTKKVFEHLDKRRNKRLVLIGSGVIAALTLGLTALFLSDRPSREIAHQPRSEAEPLMIALNHPIIDIPATSPQK